MFRPSKKEKRLDMFASISGMLKGAAYEQYNNEQSWHNMSREHVVSQIEENLFKPLFIQKMPVELPIKRNNVEATIFQLCFHTRNNKTRYRGVIRHKMWALLRCMWTNLRRIMAYMEYNGQRTLFCAKKW